MTVCLAQRNLPTHQSTYILRYFVHSLAGILQRNMWRTILMRKTWQSQLIQKMLEQVEDIPEGANITVGTIHSFQGDQCNIIIAMLNPPIGLRSVQAASKMHINNKNIINVAISRAKDYLCLLIPDKESCDGFENLIEINRLGALSNSKYHNDTALFPASQIERIIDGEDWL